MRQLFVHQHHEHTHKKRPSSGNAKVHPDGEEDEDEEDEMSVSDQSSVHDSDLALIERGGTPPDKPPKTGAGKDADRCTDLTGMFAGKTHPLCDAKARVFTCKADRGVPHQKKGVYGGCFRVQFCT